MKNKKNSIHLFLEVSKDIDENDVENDEALLIAHQCRHRVIEMSETTTQKSSISESILFDVVDLLDRDGPDMDDFDNRETMKICWEYADKMIRNADDKGEFDPNLFKRAFVSLDIWLKLRNEVDDESSFGNGTLVGGLVEEVEAKKDYCANKIWGSFSSFDDQDDDVDDVDDDKILKGVDEEDSFVDLGHEESRLQHLKREANHGTRQDPSSISSSQHQQQHESHLHVPHKEEYHKNDEEMKEHTSTGEVPSFSTTTTTTTTTTPASIMSSRLKKVLPPTVEEEEVSSSSSSHHKSLPGKEKEQQNHYHHPTQHQHDQYNSSQSHEDNKTQFVSPKEAIGPTKTSHNQPFIPRNEKQFVSPKEAVGATKTSHKQPFIPLENETGHEKKADESYVAKMNDVTPGRRCVHDGSKGKASLALKQHKLQQQQQQQQVRTARMNNSNCDEEANTNHDNNLEGKDFVFTPGASDDISLITTQPEIKYTPPPAPPPPPPPHPHPVRRPSPTIIKQERQKQQPTPSSPKSTPSSSSSLPPPPPSPPPLPDTTSPITHDNPNTTTTKSNNDKKLQEQEQIEQKHERDYQNHIPIPSKFVVGENQIHKLRNIGYPQGLINVLGVTYLRTFAVRYWLVDNIGDEEEGMMRNMKESVNDHVKMSAFFMAPTIFRPLLINNNPEEEEHLINNIQREFPIAFHNVDDHHTQSFIRFEKRMIRLNLLDHKHNNNIRVNSSSSKLLTRHLINNIHKRVEQIASSLRRDDKKALLVMAVDGDGLLSSSSSSSSYRIDKGFLDAIRLLQSLPLHIIITLYGNEEEEEEEFADDYVTNSNNDALRFLKDELIMHFDDHHHTTTTTTNNIHILFDFEREAQEVYKHNRWLNYALPLHRIREIGGGGSNSNNKNVFNLLSERMLTKREISEFCTLVFGKKLGRWKGDHHHHLDWRGFVNKIENLLKREKVQWNPVLEREMPWIDLEELDRL